MEWLHDELQLQQRKKQEMPPCRLPPSVTERRRMQSLVQPLDGQPDVDDLLDQAQVRHPDAPLVLHQALEDDPMKAEKEKTVP